MQFLCYNPTMIIHGKINHKQREALNLFAEILFSPQMSRFVGVHIKFVRKKVKWLGMVSIEDYNLADKPREFLIEVRANQSQEEIIKTLAHEMVHVKQYVYGELNEEGTIWFDVQCGDLEYENQPWEIEAHDVTDVLYEEWILSESNTV